jgi:hypothetical protein
VISATSLRIHEFRGIRDLTLEIGGKNFAVCGPNGTGKSGIVDALEFALTGNISRLSGTGTGGLSVKDHGPHVDSRNKPDQAFVSLKVHIASLKKDATITRTVKDAKNPTFTPNTADIRAIFARVALHPEFALSRRELIRYVLAEPGKRAKEVQELLRLDEVESLRVQFQRIANAADRDARTRKGVREDAAAALQRALNIGTLSAAAVLEAANEQRKLLSLPPLALLEANTSLKDGLISLVSTPQKVRKAAATSELQLAREGLASVQSSHFEASCVTAALAMNELAADEKFLATASRDSLLRQALASFDDEVCPVCDTPWNPEEFRLHIKKKLDHFAEVSRKRSALERQLTPIVSEIERVRVCLSEVVLLGSQLRPTVACPSLQAFVVQLQHSIDAIRKFLPVRVSADFLRKAAAVPAQVIVEIGEVETAVAELPDASQQDAARDFLTIAQERLEALRSATHNLRASQQKATAARFVFDTYGETTTDALEAIYKNVEKFFSKLYRLINHDDEDKFEAKLKPSLGKLGFDVDFYGRGFFPPGAYHSEGHQDGMGLCLYLALMNYLAGDAFTFAVLDDVLMSVDSGHRRDVSKMLLEEFPNTQFILTTHDEIWLRHMKSVGLIQPKRFAHFRKWNVDLGPTEWSDREVWEELDIYLDKNDVRGAAALLRHFLEHFSKEVCQNLRAQVEFKGDAQFTLGDLLPNAIARMKKHLSAGKAAALSWGQQDKAESIAELDRKFAKIVSDSNAEQWQVNAAVHYNDWANLEVNDFRHVLHAFRALVESFLCVKCNSVLYATPAHGSAENLRCSCGEFSVNLAKK